MSEQPLISVIVPTKNAAHNIGDCITSIQQSSYPNYELIVVDGRSTDDTARIAENLGAKVIIGSGKGRAADNNIGIREAKGEIIAFTDDDCVVDKRWLERIALSVEKPGIGVAGGPDLTYVTKTTRVGLAAGHIHYFIHSLASKNGANAIIGCNSAYPKKVLLEAGGFDDDLPGAEDTPLHRRIMNLGYRIEHDPECIVYHKRRSTFRALTKKFWKYGWEMGLAHRKNPEDFKERSKQIYLLIAAAVALLILVALSVWQPVLAWTFLALVSGYVTFELALHRHLEKKTGFESSFWIFLVASTTCILAFSLGFTKEQVIRRSNA